MKISKFFRFLASFLLVFSITIAPLASTQVSANTLFNSGSMTEDDMLLDSSELAIGDEHPKYDSFIDEQMLYEEVNEEASEEGFEITYNGELTESNLIDNEYEQSYELYEDELLDDLDLASASGNWHPNRNWNGSSVFSTCRDVVYGNSFSMVVDNLEYNDAYKSLSIPVSAYSIYRISAMVKVENFANDPFEHLGGASVGALIHGSYHSSSRHRSSEWTRLTYEFTSTEAGEVTFFIRNGDFSATNRGRAYFSDVKIERADASDTTTSWNVLTLIFRNFDAPRFPRASLNDADVQHAKDTVNLIKGSFYDISGGLFSINSIDFAEVDEPIRVINRGFNHTNIDSISHILDQHIDNGDYDHIILVTPLRHIAQGWAGLGGMVHRGVGISEVNHRTGMQFGIQVTPPFTDAIFVHEILHDIERRSQLINPNTAGLHDNALFGYTDGSDEWRAWYTAYMRNTLPGNRGIDPRAYIVHRPGEFVTIHPVAVEPILTLSRTTWDAPANGGGVLISVNSNITWSDPSGDQSWLTVSRNIAPFSRSNFFHMPDIGSLIGQTSPDTLSTGSGLFRISIPPNSSINSRTGTVTVTAGTLSRTIVITQAGR